MAGRVGALTRADHAVNAAMMAAYVCNRAEDRTGLLSFCSAVENGIAQGRGGSHLAAMTRFATGIAPEFCRPTTAPLSAHLRRRLRSRTLLLILTVLPERGEHGDLLAAIRMVVPRHLPLVLLLQGCAARRHGRSLAGDRLGLCRTLVASELVQDRGGCCASCDSSAALVAETVPETAGRRR